MSAQLIPFEPRNYRVNRVAHLEPARVFAFAEHRSLVTRYDDYGREASVVARDLGELWLRAYLASIRFAMSIAGLHDSHRGENQCANPAGKNPEDFREPA